ncbi:E3 ubiquitin-protein ligase KCMF1 isoform X1 [Drosophila santomea]|uniref:E3 ubiquitin-protein ligase KCMF1 isoform X1 n=1 Tax=Drosophila santomea TaxID=129105 RepID=UPI001953F21F|nr:E3 ubiquitin-protein ligase KCMF1 isoform X1 [Drosophila santomea]
MRLYQAFDSDFPSSALGRQDVHMWGHWDVHCDGCGSSRLVHYRYKCLRCLDYDLCSTCKENGVSNGPHDRAHPLQCLMDRAALELHFAGEAIPTMCADSFTCPVCGKMGLSLEDLKEHCKAKHRLTRTVVICPVCAAVPASNPIRIAHIASHLIFMHSSSAQRDPEPASSSVAQAGGFHWPQDSAVGSGTGDGTGIGIVTQHTFPTSQTPQVRFLLPRNTAPLADSEDLSDNESLEL